MKTVNQVSKLTGVSIRTLHHYDAIGLLKASQVTQAGYRLYDDAALRRLQTILLFRELEFPLQEIRKILDSPTFNIVAAIDDQIRLLELRRQHLDDLLKHARQIQETGVISMNFKPFDTTKMDEYAAEAKAKWGKTDAYSEYEKKSAGKSKEKMNAAGEALTALLAQIGTLRHLSPDDAEVQAAVAKIQAFITDNYYTCTKQIFAGLGQMYVADDRFKENIDRAGGEGTAEFISKAIEFYCK